MSDPATELSEPAPASEGESPDRRDKDRRPFRYVQFVAPYSGTLPSTDKFSRVKCYDLSTNGFSYFSDTPPTHRQVVALLGQSSAWTCVVADIVNSTLIMDDGVPVYRIGCRFKQRVSMAHGKLAAMNLSQLDEKTAPASS